MKTRHTFELPGYVTVAMAADRLRLAPRTVRYLIYSGRLPSARLGHRHFLKIPDVEAERRRRLGLPLPQERPATLQRRARRQHLEARQTSPPSSSGATIPLRADRPVRSEARRERAAERAAQLERWLRSGHAPGMPRLPFTVVNLGAEASTCDTCRQLVRAGGRMLDAGATDGRAAARLCLTCSRRALLAWSDSRRGEAVAARRLAHDLGIATSDTLPLEPAHAAA